MKSLFATLLLFALVPPALAQSPTPAPTATPAATPAPAPAAEAPKERARRFVVGAYYGGTDTLTFREVQVTSGGSTDKGEATFESEPNLGLILEYRQMPQQSWGFQAGLIIEGKRDFTKAKSTSGGTTTEVTYTGTRPNYRQEVLYANAVYKWEQFYIPFGLNYAIPHFTPGQTNSTFTIRGQVGVQFGLGFQFTELFGMELMAQATGVNLRAVSSSTTVEYGDGIMGSGRLHAKFAF